MSEGSLLPDGSTGNACLDAVLAARRPDAAGRTGADLDLVALLALLEVVDVELGQVVHEPGVAVRYVWFPRTAVFGLLTPTGATGATGAPGVEAMAVGQEGLVGLAAVLGDGTSPHQALCQVPGQALRWPVEVLHALLETEPSVRGLLGRHIQSAVVLLSQRLACSQRHTAQQRCADWLLRHADRVGPHPMPVTQQFLGAMLGLRRTTVSTVVSQFQRSRLISYRRGRVVVTDHLALQRLACSCYALFRQERQKLTANGPAGTTPAP